MDFCLRVVEFGVNMMYISAICFNTDVERREWVREKIDSHVEFVALYTDRAGLRGESTPYVRYLPDPNY